MISKARFPGVAAIVMAILLIAQRGSAGQSFPLDSIQGLQPHDVAAEPTTYQGRKAIRVIPLPESEAAAAAGKTASGGGIVVLPGTLFHNGTIEVDVSGNPALAQRPMPVGLSVWHFG